MGQTSLAVIITCRNRKLTTALCLERLFSQMLPEGHELDVYLTDDGSDDGTAEHVSQRFPRCHVIRGDGTLYWGGGTRLAFQRAMAARHYDLFLWLNDDTFLEQGGLAELLEVYAISGAGCGGKLLVIGAVRGPLPGEALYGGYRRRRGWNPLLFDRIGPSGSPEKCDSMDGNCVLVPFRAASEIGAPDPRLRHYHADVDYALSAAKKGYQLLLTRRFVGECEKHPFRLWRAPDLGFRERFKLFCGPKGPPVGEWLYFCRKHAGPLWPAALLFFFAANVKHLMALTSSHIFRRFRARLAVR